MKDNETAGVTSSRKEGTKENGPARKAQGGKGGGLHSTKERLAEAAMKLFGEHGYDGASTRKLAMEAKCNISLIAFHYGGKAALYEEALGRVRGHIAKVVAPLVEELGALLSKGAGAEELCLCLKSHIGQILGALLVKDYSRSRYMLLLRCMQDVDGDGKLLFEEVLAPLLDVLEAVAHRSAPGVSKEKARMASWLLVSSVIAVLRDGPPFLAHCGQIDAGTGELSLETAQAFASMLFAGFMAGVGAR